MAVREKWKRRRPLSIPTGEAVDRVCGYFRKDPRVQLVYLFGSRARKAAPNSESDIDIAYLTTDAYRWDDYYAATAAIPRLVESGRVDLVWLNQADPVLKFEVVKSGNLVLSASTEVENEFEYRTTRAFWDYRIYLDRHMAARRGREK